MPEDDEISPAPPLPAGAEGQQQPPPSRRSQGPSPPPHSDSHGPLNRQGTDESTVRDRDGKDGKPGKSGKSGHGFGGLKRLSTIMGRRKSSAAPPLPSHHDDHNAPPHPQSHHAHGHLAASGGGTWSGSDTLTKKSKRNSFMPFRRNTDSAKQSFQSIDSQPHLHRRSGSVTSTGDDQIDSPVRDVTPSYLQAEQREVSGSHPAPDSILELPEPGEGHRNWLQSQSARQPQTDAEGFTVRPSTEDEITRLQREAAAAGHLDEEHAIKIRDKKIEEDENAAQQAMTQMANTLRIQAEQSGLRGSGTIRGRRDARNAVFGPSSSSVPPKPPAHAHGRPNLALNVDNRMSGTTISSPSSPYPVPPQPHSPHSSQLSRPPRTMASLSSDQDSTSLYSTVRRNRPTIFKHPEITAPGLNVSLIECLSSRITESNIASSLVGEIAFAYNPVEETRQDVKIRLDNHTVTEKLAANPTIVTPTQTAGEYNLNLSRVLRSTPQVVFKQSVPLNPQQLDAHSPVIFKPLWHLQDFQASVIINYEANPAFLSTVPNQKVTLSNVRITVNLDTKSAREGQQTPARAVSAITYPSEGARFNPRRSAVTWELPTLEVPPQGEESKFLARFGCSTPGPKAGHVDVSFDFVTELGLETSSPRLGVSMFEEDGRKTEKDPFADDDTDDDNTVDDAWKVVPTTWTLKASKYTIQ